MFVDVLKEVAAYILKILVIAIVAYGIAAAKAAFYKHFDTDEKRKIAKTVVQSVEQMSKSLHGEAKLNEALKLAEKMSQAAGLPFDAVEMRALIECAVAEANHVFDGKKEKEDPLEAEVAAEETVSE